MTTSRALALLLAAAFAACAPPPPAVTTCTTRSQCPGALPCIGGICQEAIHALDCQTGATCETIQAEAVDQLDLLLMVDDSGSMSEEQISLVMEIPRLVGRLTRGDLDDDGDQDFLPLRSLHVGIISSDLGTGPVTGIESCRESAGDDAVLHRTGSTGTGCMETYPSAVFELTNGVDDLDTFSTSVGCVAALGNDGCGFEHQLEAPLKALSPAPTSAGTSPVTWTRAGYRPPVFLGGTFGHGGEGGANEGFLRPSSVLAVLLLSDEEDCSALDPSIFDRTNPAYSSVDLNLRCHTFTDAVYPVQRYVDGFIGLRADPERLVFGAIVGVPQSAVDDGVSYDGLLALEEMTERIDPVLHNRLLPSCTSPGGRGVAYPPRRIVQVAQGLERLGAATTVQSICNTSFSGAFDAFLEQIAGAFRPACLARPLTADAAGEVDCEVFARLPAIGGAEELQHCADLPSAGAYELARTEIETIDGVETAREVCRVRQVGSAGAGVTPGWFYDDGSLGAASMLSPGCGQRISFSTLAPVSGAELVLVCSS